MIVTVALAGYRARWRFRDSHLVEAWVASRPWDEGTGRVAMVRCRLRHSIVVDASGETRAHERTQPPRSSPSMPETPRDAAQLSSSPALARIERHKRL
jgi:hypothetical protein